MAAAISGTLLSSDFLEFELASTLGAEPVIAAGATREFSRLRASAQAALGPRSAAMAVLDLAARPLARWLGWTASMDPLAAHANCETRVLVDVSAETVALVAIPWARSLAGAERAAAAAALSLGLRWAFISNGRTVRIVDAARMPPASLEFDLDLCAQEVRSLARLRALAGPSAFRSAGAGLIIERARDRSDASGVRVCEELQRGVRGALRTFEAAIATGKGRRRHAGTHAGEALTAVYRVLFLLFAEARGLVPSWHPIYRDGYTIAALVARLEQSGSIRGTWAALQAMARLAHAGCFAGELRVTAFNSRLFSPGAAPLLDHLALDDGAVGKALCALAFQSGSSGRRRVAYADLGVEQLGSVYERLLDDSPATDERGVPRISRKASGTFYTPLALTEYLVRATLGPLVADRTSAEILALRVLDPSMGSGAFLVSACRFLAAAVERALVVEGALEEHDASEEERTKIRRLVAQRCLFGVDLNPMAVQLAELSLWLATLAAEHPISFLDHHLRCGNSLIGARPLDVMERAPGSPRAAGRTALPLDAFFEQEEALSALLPPRAQLEREPDSNAAIVHGKERTLEELARHPALVRWRQACDLWCAAAMDQTRSRGTYGALIDHTFGRPCALPQHLIDDALERAIAAARRAYAFHWPLEFPEVFLDDRGRSRVDGGFDAVLGNPPWEMLRKDPGTTSERRDLLRFSRAVCTAQSKGHANEYQLFLERALKLLKPGGRLGMLVPSGLLTDAGAAPLRRLLLDRHAFESVAVFDNRRAIFPIHRGLRFAAITVATGGNRRGVRCRFGLHAAESAHTLDPSSGEGFPITVTATLLESLSGPALAFPDLPSSTDAALVERLYTRHRMLSDPEGWAVTFGRELNATDDRDCLRQHGGSTSLRVYEGRDLEPFRIRAGREARWASRAAVVARLGARADAIDRPRLAYREVASSTNRTTLIAAIVPAGAVTLHTIFCCRMHLPGEQAFALCALMNSYVANYLVRRWVTTHVTAGVIARVPVPFPDDRMRERLARLARALARRPHPRIEARVQAAAGVAYELTRGEFEHVIATFPLVDRSARQAALEAFSDGARS